MQEVAFKSDIERIRRRAREHIDNGAVTCGYDGNVETVVGLLNDALATELVCALRYKRHHYMATGIDAQNAAREFSEHAEEELQHADALANRIVQLGGEPDFAPDSLASRSHSEYMPATTLREMIRENLVAERIAIDTYREMIRFIADHDPTTRRMLEDILITEEEHADELAGLIPGSENEQ